MLKFFNREILFYFSIWRISLFLVALIAPFVILEFGARFPYYEEILMSSGLPQWIWGFGNFDGVHYLTIAQNGYFAQFTQAFFPLYPLIISIFSFNGSFLISAIILSNILFLIALFLLYKLFQMDYSNEISLRAVLLLLAFPTSFYFGSVYSESLFLLLIVLSLITVRSNNFLAGGMSAALASATRIYGVLLTPVLLMEAFLERKKENGKVKRWDFLRTIMGILIAPLGLIAYMVFLKIQYGDALYFLSAQPAFGAERTDVPFVLLPQVVFRYLKILFTVPPESYAFFTAVSELAFTGTFLVLLIFSYKHIRKSYWVFSLLAFFLPTLTGTLSSMPRYVLVCFLLFPYIVKVLGKSFKFAVIFMILLQIIFLALFIQGYWIA